MTISEAKSKCANKEPFLGSILFSMPVIEMPEIGTLGVDGDVLYVNMEFWNKHSNKEQYALLMHEAGHLFLNHIWRGRNYKDIAVDPKTGQTISVFNMAGDYVINLMIDADKRFQMPKGCLLDHKYDGWATEEVYQDLQKTIPKMTQQQLQQMIDSGLCNKSMWGKHQGKEGKEIEKKWQNKIKQATEYARTRYKGNEPAWLKRMYEDLQPKEDWRVLLREYAQPYQGDYSFSPVDRRFLGSDFILPDIKDGEEIDWVAICIDTSGSIGDTELNAFLGEIRGILGAYDRVKVKLCFCDTEASPFVELTEFEKDKIKATGGGGTDFTAPFKLVEKEDTEPKLFLYFTDLQGSCSYKEPAYPVVWVAIDKGTAPFGKVMPYKV
jgi:predicted metal-dependent peptidase